MKTFYLAGPMRGYKYYNWPAFDSARNILQRMGYQAISPADLDRVEGFSCFTPQSHLDAGTVRKLFSNSVTHLLRDADAILLLKGWKKSSGARAELACAQAIGLPVYVLDGEQVMPYVEDEPDGDLMEEVIDITNGARQASYGPPDKDFGIIARRWSILWEEKLRPGVVLDPIDVGHAMIDLKMSRQSHQRKFDNLRDIGGYDRCVARIHLADERRRRGGALPPIPQGG